VRVLGVFLLAISVLVGAPAVLWTLWRAVGAEVDYCPDGNCITAYWITIPALLAAIILGWAGAKLLRRRM
jgi:hypothetical protein